MIDKKELMIMAELRRNSRETLTQLSKRTRIPISTIYDKIKTQEQKIIKKHTSILDFGKLGFSTRATILVSIRKDKKGDIVEHITKHHNVNSVFKINNGYDFMIEGIFKQIKDLEEFIDMLDEKYHLKKTQVYYIIEELKREGFLSSQETIDLLGIDE